MANLKPWLIAGGVVAIAVVLLWALLRDGHASLGALANPGPLSDPHAFLANDCAACHTPLRGVEDSNCIVCHANASSILQRQPTAFHADIGDCAKCHREHRRPPARLSEMDHELLANLGRSQLEDAASGSEASAAAERLESWLVSGRAQSALPPNHVDLTPLERTLNCMACHANDDRHFALFGNDCAACHGTSKWTIADFQHPSPASRDCAHCHQAPPSHYMMHFHMISARVAGKPHAEVSQCFLCHQTTSWNDILGKGWYKHH